MNCLVEIKKEYTITLVNIITPSIYQGIESIYKESHQLGNQDDILKIFQGLLRRVPKWNLDLIEVEAKRILTNSKCSDWLYDLVKAVIKSNITLLSNSSFKGKKKSLINPDFYENISFSDFIHKVYIECAREIWNNPYLFSHDYNPIDIKRNQRDAIVLIKEAIKEAIRKMLPVRHILEEYLGNNIIDEDDDFSTSVNNIQSHNIKSLLRKDLENNIIESRLRNGSISPVLSHINSEYEKHSLTPSKPLVDENDKQSEDNITDGVFKTKSTSIRLSSLSNENNSRKTDKKTVNKEDIINILRDTHASEENEKKQFGGNLDGDIKSILKNDLYNSGSDNSETSISYTGGGHLNDDNFEDVFSNVNGNRKSNIEISSIASEIFINNLIDDNDKKKSKKNKFFSNYVSH